MKLGDKYIFPLVATLLVLMASSAESQRIPRLGLLSGSGDRNNRGPAIEAFRQGLREFGYIEGKNILVEYRYAEGRIDRIPNLVTELLQAKVDILVTGLITAIRAAKNATKITPIVMVTSQDPVAFGIVNSLSRPGGNITGLTRLTRQLSGKRLELLTEVSTGTKRIGILGDPTTTGSAIAFKEYQSAARTLNIELIRLEARGPQPNLDDAFEAASKAALSSFVMVSNPVFTRVSQRIAALAIKNRLKSMYEGSDWVDAGGLMSYGASDADSYRRAAFYVDKILKGAKPADLPIEQPTKFELVVNLKTAKEIGLVVPQRVLLKADRVIK